jgi:hypothetical protein
MRIEHLYRTTVLVVFQICKSMLAFISSIR